MSSGIGPQDMFLWGKDETGIKLVLAGNHLWSAGSVLRKLGMIAGHTAHNSLRGTTTAVEFRPDGSLTIGKRQAIARHYGNRLIEFVRE